MGARRGLAARLVADAGHTAAVGEALEVTPDDAVVDRVLQDGEEVGGRRPAHLQPQLAGAGIEHHVGLVAVVLKPHPLAPVQVLAVVVRQHDEPAHDAVGHEVQVEDHAHFRLVGQHLRPGGKLGRRAVGQQQRDHALFAARLRLLQLVTDEESLQHAQKNRIEHTLVVVPRCGGSKVVNRTHRGAGHE